MQELIAEIEKNKTEKIRIEVSEFEGRNLINIRIWYRSQAIDEATGEYIYKPTQKGITLDVLKFHELKKGIDRLDAWIKDVNLGTTPDQPGEITQNAESEEDEDKEKEKEKDKEKDTEKEEEKASEE